MTTAVYTSLCYSSSFLKMTSEGSTATLSSQIVLQPLMFGLQKWLHWCYEMRLARELVSYSFDTNMVWSSGSVKLLASLALTKNSFCQAEVYSTTVLEQNKSIPQTPILYGLTVVYQPHVPHIVYTDTCLASSLSHEFSTTLCMR